MFRRYYENSRTIRLGYDFYADIAERIVAKRKDLCLTQEQLAKKAGVPVSKLKRYEEVKIRCSLDDLNKLSAALDVTTDYLIGATYDDPDCADCLYLVWNERHEQGPYGPFEMYFRASSPQMAFLKAYKWSIDENCIWFETRDRARIKLVGVPVRKADYSHLKTRKPGADDEIARADEVSVNTKPQ